VTLRLPVGPSVFLAIGVVIGSFNALQARVNAELGAVVGDSFFAALISISIGFLVIAMSLAFSARGRRGVLSIPLALRERRLVWWHLLGGVSGAFYAVAQTLTGFFLGVALFSVAVVSGQAVSSLIMDRLGVGPGGRYSTSAPRLIGAALVVLAVLVSVAGQLSEQTQVLWAWMPLLAGAGMGWQLAVNGRVRMQTQSVLAATFINFGVATALLGTIVAIRALVLGPPPSVGASLWLLSGGILGVLFIAGSAFVVHKIGVLMLGISVVAGQLIGALFIDILSPSPLHPLTVPTVIGVAIALIAVGISSIPFQKPKLA